MSFIEMIFGDFVFDFLWKLARRIGSLLRWPFLNGKYSIDEIFQQFWSGIIGIVFFVLSISAGLLLVS